MKLLQTILALFLAFACVALSCASFAKEPHGVAIARSEAKPSPACADFLAQQQKKPAHLTFITCISQPERQGKPLRATYHVRGMFAAQVEATLIKSVGLNRLKRSCCQWDSPATSFLSTKKQTFIISMVSEETAVSKRSQWREIPSFEITVELLTEEI